MLYQFEISLSDVDRGIYQTLEFRLNQHPSENGLYLLTRALAYALSYQENLQFSPQGLADPDVPALLAPDPMGGYELWIEIGNPSPKRLHKASKVSKNVQVYTYKNPELIVKEVASETVHRAKEIAIFGLDTKFLEQLESDLKKRNVWALLRQEEILDLATSDVNLSTTVRRIRARD
jgi:uncharacterized protein YaeQ